MQIHLFSDGGEDFLGNVIEACGNILAGAARPIIAYLPAASVDDSYFEMARTTLAPLGDVLTIDIDHDPIEQTRSAIERASVVFMPGGNTYLLNSRLKRTGIHALIRDRARRGLPLVGVSAGSVVCGKSMLTTNDMNCCACTEFDGLGLVPYNLNVHYPDADGPARDLRIERLWEVHHFIDTPVIALEDSAYVLVDERGSRLVRGVAWRFEQGKTGGERVEVGSF
jgi:dipeptidase E